jgi:hypothetical protein
MNAFHVASSLVRARPRGHICCFYRPRHGPQSPLLTKVGTFLPTTRASSSSNFDDDLPEEVERKWTLLYHRSPSRNSPPRALFGMSTFNLLYWTWYVVDFTPAINGSAQTKAAMGQIDKQTLELLLVDPTMGYVGLGVSSVIWLGAFLYSKQLVSAIWASHTTAVEGEEILLAVATLKLPFLTQPKVLRKVVYDPESNNFDGAGEAVLFTESDITSTASIFAPGELALSEEKKKHDAIVRFGGDFSRLRGFVALKKEEENEKDGPLASLLQQKYLIDISSADEVMPNASPILMHSLVTQDYPLASGNNGSKKSRNNLGSAVIKRKTGRQRPVSQLEMARGTLKEAIKRKQDFDKRT